MRKLDCLYDYQEYITRNKKKRIFVSKKKFDDLRKLCIAFCGWCPEFNIDGVRHIFIYNVKVFVRRDLK